MVGAKPPKNKGKIKDRVLYSRINFLYQAAGVLAQQTHAINPDANDARPAISRRLISDARAVSLKALIRMSPAMKYTICKKCDTFLIEGSSCTTEVENKSKGGRKPWADVMVRTCKLCGQAKRFPVDLERQKRRPHRGLKEEIEKHSGQV